MREKNKKDTFIIMPVNYILTFQCIFGVPRPTPSPVFTLFPVTSTLPEISLLPRRKNEIFFVNRPVFLLINVQPQHPIFKLQLQI